VARKRRSTMNLLDAGRRRRARKWFASPFSKAVSLMFSGLVAFLLAFGSLVLPGGPVVAVLLFSLGMLLSLLPLGVGCPRCGHSIILPIEPIEKRRALHFGTPTRRCRKCGNRLDRPNDEPAAPSRSV